MSAALSKILKRSLRAAATSDEDPAWDKLLDAYPPLDVLDAFERLSRLGLVADLATTRAGEEYVRRQLGSTPPAAPPRP